MSPEDVAIPGDASLVEDISAVLGLPPAKVRGAVELLSEGATLPFIARYRKERTGGLDEASLRSIQDQAAYFRELYERKRTVLRTIEEQGKLTDDLRRRILSTSDKRELEDLYLPFKPKRRTRAAMAREKGLEPLAAYLRAQENRLPSREEVVGPYVSPAKGVPDAEAALRGACDIVAEEWAEDPGIRRWLRSELSAGALVSRVRKEWKEKPSKFEMYYEFREPIARIPSHRYLAIRRGEKDGVLSLKIEVDEESILKKLRGRVIKNPRFHFHEDLIATVSDAYHRLLGQSIETEVLVETKERADEEAIAVFSRNLHDLLMAPPAGSRVVLGIDPGFRTGCKVAVVDGTGKFLEHAAIYPTPPRADVDEAGRVITALLKRHGVEIIAIGNGTASRETEAFLDGLARTNKAPVPHFVVNEAGASVYSASEIAQAEFPSLDVTVRGAISIARRLQDPLAELVKIDPKSLGVGQYQHDVNQTRLRAALDREVESCVNRVGVDVNTASARLLSYVSGIGPRLAEGIVEHRDTQGPFRKRRDLLSVPRLGQRAFEQGAGFLRIRGAEQPLDDSAVHPESYRVVERMARAAQSSLGELIGNEHLLKGLDPAQFVDEKAGLPTVKDILKELEKPGRDPRKEFRLPRFAEGISEISDLEPGMLLEGVVTNVTRFGAFVDVGVHQDGLIHVSELAEKYVKDPADVVTVGDIVRVQILSVDPERKRIALSRKRAGGPPTR